MLSLWENNEKLISDQDAKTKFSLFFCISKISNSSGFRGKHILTTIAAPTEDV
jgi:hypothetical protein